MGVPEWLGTLGVTKCVQPMPAVQENHGGFVIIHEHFISFKFGIEIS